RARRLRVGGGLRRPGGLLLPEQPVGHLRADRAPVASAAVPAGARLRLPRHPGGRQRRARLPGGHPLGAGGVPARQRAGADRGLHLPHGRAHHHRRPDPLPAVGRGGDVEAEGPDRAGPGLPHPQRGSGRVVLRTSRGRGRRVRRRPARIRLHHGGPAAGADLRQRLRRAIGGAGQAARGVPRLPRRLRRRRALMSATTQPNVDVPASSTVQNLTIGKAINLGLRAAMEKDSKVVVMGEDVGKLGGVFRITDGLQKDFGEQRVLDTPLAESGIIGTAVGLAVRGFRPVCEIQFEGFIFPGFDQINSQVAKLHARTQGRIKVPMVIRVPYGGGIGAVEHHSESPESYFAHLAGVKAVTPSNPVDAYWMIQQAIFSDDPILVFEPKKLYHMGTLKAPVDTAAEPMPLFASKVLRTGTAATLVGYGPTVKLCLEVAEAAAEEGNELEVIDLRALSP